ncbi:MAG: cytochrome P450 [Myxococcales bacterium]|nr:MAG: cytochrome P450 [Myxococcales bacterium]
MSLNTTADNTHEAETAPLNQDVTAWELPGMELHELMDRLREQAPIVPVMFMGMPSWLITRQAELEQAFKDSEHLPPERAYKFGIEPLIGETFQSMSGERHRFYRKLATPTFRPRMVEQINFTMFSDVANELIDTFVDDGEADLVAQFTERYPHIVIARLLGLPRDEEEQFARWVVGILNFKLDPARARECRDQLWAYLDPVIDERTRNPKDDVISQLIRDEVDGVRMTREQVKSNVAIMFTAGSSTTHDSIGNLVYGLTTTEDYWERVRDRPELRDNAIEEALRWEPAVSFLPRLSQMAGSLPFAGVEIQPNSFVLMGIAAANHDPALYEAPHRFDIYRTSAKKMTFGHGVRLCPGMHLAKKEIRVSLDALLRRLPNLELTEREHSAPSGTIFRQPKQLRCRF